jgi:hypothetical protein
MYHTETFQLAKQTCYLPVDVISHVATKLKAVKLRLIMQVHDSQNRGCDHTKHTYLPIKFQAAFRLAAHQSEHSAAVSHTHHKKLTCENRANAQCERAC